MKKLNNRGKVTKGLVALFALMTVVVYNALPMINASADSTVSLVVPFKDGNNQYGHVEYSGDNGTTWNSITENTTSTGIEVNVVDFYHLQVRIVPNNNYSIDWTAMTYSEDEQVYALNSNDNSSISVGLFGNNGYYVNNGVSKAKVENIEFRENDNNQGGGDEPNQSQFNGKAYLIWSCGDNNEGICYHLFEDIVTTSDTNTKYYSASTITDDDQNGSHEVFSLNAQTKGFVTQEAFNEYSQFVQENNIDISNFTAEQVLRGTVNQQQKEQELIENGTCTDPMDFRRCYEEHTTIVDRGIELDPMEAPQGNSSYSSFGDRNFKVTIYDDNFVGVTLGDISSFEYFPNFWNELQFADSYDLTGSTKTKPVQIEAALVEDTITIKSKGFNGIEFTKVEALDVPTGAVTVTKNGNDFAIHYGSNFYDRVVFKITASNSKTYYLRIARITAKVYDNFGPNVEDRRLQAQVYYDAEKSYEDYEVYMTYVKQDGSFLLVKATHDNEFRDSLGNPVEDETSGERDNKLKLSQWSAPTPDESEYVGAYINVVKAGSTLTNYAGTFNGAGRGLYYDISTRRVDYSK